MQMMRGRGLGFSPSARCANAMIADCSATTSSRAAVLANAFPTTRTFLTRLEAHVISSHRRADVCCCCISGAAASSARVTLATVSLQLIRCFERLPVSLQLTCRCHQWPMAAQLSCATVCTSLATMKPVCVAHAAAAVSCRPRSSSISFFPNALTLNLAASVTAAAVPRSCAPPARAARI